MPNTEINALIDPIMTLIVAENLARAKANAAEPYVHATYEVHADRIHRLVDVISDGDGELAARFYESLFDITYDGVDWARDVFNRHVADRVEEELEAADPEAYWAAREAAWLAEDAI